jgi:CheY-like chemotaxis protein
MTSEVKARIFEPLFTTKANGKGRGLGLAAAYAIVKQARGDIVVHSAPGRGPVFTIYLPALNPRTEAHKPMQRASAPNPAAPQTILLVEHEASQREIAREYLRSRGYQVLLADNGLAAQELCKAYAGPIDVLVTGLGGSEFASNARKARPELRVIFVTGEAEPEFSWEDIGHSAVLLHKLYSLVELGQRIRVVGSRRLAMGA